MCFWVLCVFYGVWKREKRAEKLGREHKIKKKNVFFFGLRGAWGYL